VGCEKLEVVECMTRGCCIFKMCPWRSVKGFASRSRRSLRMSACTMHRENSIAMPSGFGGGSKM
jgi:hypothetical protein